jgi:hypothetical protein
MVDEIKELKIRNQDLLDRQQAVGGTKDEDKNKEMTLTSDHNCFAVAHNVPSIEGDLEYNNRTKKHIDIFNEQIQSLKLKGEKYFDHEFPGDHTSLIRDWDS